MDQYEILKTRYRIGHPLLGTVVGIKREFAFGKLVWARTWLKIEGAEHAVLSYYEMLEGPYDFENLDPALLPSIGQRLEVVVMNYVDGILYVSSTPRKLTEEAIQRAKDYYRYVDEMQEGMAVQGTVSFVAPFGLFVDIGLPFPGLIDIGHISFNGGKQLPSDPDDWPKVGERIQCVMAYFRLHNYQFGLGWKPE